MLVEIVVISLFSLDRLFLAILGFHRNLAMRLNELRFHLLLLFLLRFQSLKATLPQPCSESTYDSFMINVKIVDFLPTFSQPRLRRQILAHEVLNQVLAWQFADHC